MAVLVAFLAVAAVSVATVGYVRAARRDTRSVEGYRTVMDHLEHLTATGPAPAEEEAGSAHVRVLAEWPDEVAGPATEADERTDEATTPGPAPLGAGQWPASRPPVERPLVFIDGAVSGTGEQQAGPAPAPTSPTPAPHLAGIPGSKARTSRTVRRGGAAAGVAALVALGAALALHLDHRAGGPRRPAPSASAPTHRSPSTHRARPAPPTTARPQSSVVPVSKEPSGAVYAVGSLPVNVSLVASGRCWVEVRSGSGTGPIVFEGTINPGGSQSFGDGAGLWMRFGNPAGVEVRSDGTVLAMPSVAAPYNLTIEGPSSSPA
jgi:hypothetical protein